MCTERPQRFGPVLGTIVGMTLLCLTGVPCQSRTAAETTAILRNEIETDPAPSPAYRVEACVELLEQEVMFPSAPAFGIGGGPIDTGHLQEVIMGSVCTFAQKKAERDEIRSIVAAKLQSTPASDQAMRDRLTIILGYTGDVSVAPQLISILENHPDGFMRCSTAQALREMRYVPPNEYVPALKRVMESDTYARVRLSGCLVRYDSATMVYSPVRDMVACTLRRMGFSVPKGVEIVEAKYGVQRVEPLLYDRGNPKCIKASIKVLGLIGSVEAVTALEIFVDTETGVTGMEALVEKAQATLDRLHAPH